MVARPIDLPEFGTGGGNELEPSVPKKLAGWANGESPGSNVMNWLHHTNYDWAAYVAEHVDQFAVIAQTVPDDTIQITAGIIRSGLILTNVAVQNTGTFTFPSGDPRIDRIVLDSAGAVQVITGAEDASPVPPAITSDVTTLAQVALSVGQTEIIQANITPERTNPYQNQFVQSTLVATDSLASYQAIDGLALEYDTGNDQGMITASGVGTVNRDIELRALLAGAPNADQILLDSDGGVVIGAPGAGSLGAYTLNVENQIAIGASVDSGIAFHIEVSGTEKVRLQSTLATGNTYISFYQTTTRRAIIGYFDSSDDLQIASDYGRISFQTDSAGSAVLRGYVDPDGGLVWGAPSAGSLGAGTLNVENQIGISTSVDSGIAFHIEVAGPEFIRLQNTSATGNINIAFYQTTTRRALLQFVDTDNDFKFLSDFGRVSFWTDSAGAPALRGYIDPDGGLVWGVPTGATKGAGTVNAENGFYEDGEKLIVPPADVANYVKGLTFFRFEDTANTNAFYDVDSNLTENTHESIGPTGSGADNIFTELNVLPTSAKFVVLKLLVQIVGSAASTGYGIEVRARQTGSSTNSFNSGIVGEANVETNSSGDGQSSHVSEITVPLDSSQRFDMWWDRLVTLGSPFVFIMLVGWYE